MAVIKYQPMPLIDEKNWLTLLSGHGPGPTDPARPVFQPQSNLNACVPFSVASGEEFLARKLHHSTTPVSGLDLYHKLDASPTGYAPGDVFPVAMREEISGWKLKEPLYDASIGTHTPDERFARAFSRSLRRWPVLIGALRPAPPGPDGWVTNWLPLHLNPIRGHSMIAYKPTWRHWGTGIDYGFYCLDPSSGAHPYVAISRRLLTHASFYSYRALTKV